jgi:hypothetical protein
VKAIIVISILQLTILISPTFAKTNPSHLERNENINNQTQHQSFYYQSTKTLTPIHSYQLNNIS